jgi:hypothetical protein
MMANLLEVTGRETLNYLDYVGSLNIQLWATLRGFRQALPLIGNRHRWHAAINQVLENSLSTFAPAYGPYAIG